MTNSNLIDGLNSTELLDVSTEAARSFLTDFAADLEFDPKVALAFGTSFNAQVLENLKEQWKSNNFTVLPEIEIRTAAELNGARGAFSSNTNTIYLSREFIARNATNPQTITSVLLEEIGHFVDFRINQFDAPGDEGEIFLSLTQGIPLTSEKLQALKAENDSDTIALNGQLISIEKAGGYNGNNLKTALVNSIPTFLDQVKGYINNEVLKGLPIFADRLGIANPIDSLLDGFKSQIVNELNAITTPDITPDQAKDIIFNILGPDSTLKLLQDRNGDGKIKPEDIDVQLKNNDTQVEIKLKIGQTVKPSISLNEDLGLPFFGLKLNGGVTPNLGFEWNLDFGVDQNNGFFLNTAGNDPELKLKLDAQLKDTNNQPLTLNGKLGFLQVSATDQGSEFKGDFSVDLKGTLSNLSVDSKLTGNTNLKLGLTTSLGDQAKLPSISTDLNLLGWNFTDELKTGGKYQGQQPTVEFNNVRLNLGSFFKDFTKPVFGTIGDILSPIQPVLDVLGTKLPILDDFGRSFLDVTGGFPSGKDGKVTLLDLVKLQQPNAPIDFIGAVSKVAELTESINTLSEQASIPLSVGGFKLGPGDNILSSNFSLEKVNLDPLNSTSKPVDTILAELKSLLGNSPEIQNFVGAVQESSGPQFPILTDSTQVFKLLLGQKADFFKYTLPPLKFDFGFDKFIPILGPLGARLQGGLASKIKLGLGYDSTGITTFVNSGNVADIFENGFYLANGPDPNGPGGRESGAELTATLKAYAELNAVVARAGVGGGIESNISILLKDRPPGDNRVYFSELDPNCLFDPIKGKFTAGLDAYIKFGIGIFSYTKRFDIAKKTLLDFETGCNAKEKAAIAAKSVLATPLSTGVLRLNMGPDAAARIINGQPGSDIDEIFTVNTANNGNLNISAFDITKQYQTPNQIVAKGGANKDTIVIADAVSTPASLEGGNEDDQLYSGSGNDTLKGDAGNDALKGSQGDDILEGGQDDDLLVGGLGADRLDGGDGIDTASYKDSATGIRITPSAGALVGTLGEAQGDRLISIEQIEGSNFADAIEGDSSSNILEGLGGNDNLKGGAGDDVLIGGSGRDTLDGGNGQDWTSYLTSSGAVNVNLATNKALGGDAEGESLISIENLQGSAFDDNLVGSAANNWLDGFYGNDKLTGGGGADTLDGGGGIDWAKYNTSANAVDVNLKTGIGSGGYAQGDKLLLTSDEDQNPATVYNSIENLEGSAFADNLAGDSGLNILKGLVGNDILKGDGGNDTLIGGAGADTLDGGGGIDWADYSESSGFVRVDLAANINANADALDDIFIQFIGISTVENLRGSKFADFLAGDKGNNEINPGLSYASNGGIDLVNGSGGNDLLTLDYSLRDEGKGLSGGFQNTATGSGFISRNQADNSSILDGVNFTNIERLNVIGTIQNDQIIGGPDNDILLMGAGDDTIYGGRGSNRILADEGNDFVVDQNDINGNFLEGMPDNSLIDLDGGRGIDTLSVDLSGKFVSVKNAEGNEIAIIPFDITLESTNPLVENPNQRFTVLNGTIAISNFEVFKDLKTGDGNDKLTQLGRVDNQFNAGNGNDIVNPGLGFDTVDGGSIFGDRFNDNDLLILDYSVGDTGSAMVMSVSPTEQSGFAFRTIDPNNIEAPLLDAVNFINFENYQVTGTSKNDDLTVGDGNDTVNGAAGDDALTGNRGNDLLLGGEGNDTIKGTNSTNYGGGFGDSNPPDYANDIDTLTGNTGADTFILGDAINLYYDNFGNSDYALITDFNPAEGDIIQLNKCGNNGTYFLSQSPEGLPSGTAIFGSSNSWPFGNDLIAIVQGATNLNLTEPYFNLVGDFCQIVK